MALEQEFHRAMLDLYRVARTEGYTASYFLKMVNERGGVAAAKKLINDSTPSDGFTRLWEMGRLDLTVEALVEEPKWAQLFTSDELRRAGERLRQYQGGLT